MKRLFTALLAVLLLTLCAVLCAALCACGGETSSTPAASSTPAETSTEPGSATEPASSETPVSSAAPEETTDDGGDELVVPDAYSLHIPYGKADVDGVREEAWNSAARVPVDQVKKDNPSGDVEVYASVMWDEEGLYFLFEITDPVISQTGNRGDYNLDSIYLYVCEDMETSAGAFDNFGYGVYQFALINKTQEMLPRYGIADEVKNAQSAYTQTETGLVIEFSYTPSVFPTAAGNELMIDFQYNDAANGTRNGALGWFNPTDTNADPYLWGMAVLLEQGKVSPES